MTDRFGSSARRAFLRLFLVQGSWNYRTMLSGGFLYALLPLIDGDDEDREEVALRHTGHFNAHPYMAGLAVGAVARLESDGVDPVRIQRFKDALRGPLGSLGDGFFWGAWLPLCVLLGAVMILMGAPAWAALGVLLVVYNGVHFLVRERLLRWGLAGGESAPGRLRNAHIPERTERIRDVGVLLLGLVLGLLLAKGFQPWGATTLPWALVSLLLFPVLVRGGPHAARAVARLAPVLLLLLFMLSGM